jgi:hypothetical protein
LDYVHTLTKFNFSINEINLLNQYVDKYLISLITGLSQKSFGINTITQVAKKILNLRTEFGFDKEWFIDSGGYSIIVGDIHPRDMTKCIQCYHYYLENYHKDFDMIFSLDIPFSLRYPQFNTIKYILDQNFLSANMSKNILDNNKELYNKFVFVWHFKMYNQYLIWDEFYNDVFSGAEDLHNFGIGGQVGLRGITNIDFSPFLGMTYKILKIIKEKNLNKTSLIHMLGIYGLQDRFLMAFMDKLFNQFYFRDLAPKIRITYDTVHHTIQGFFKGRRLKPVIIDPHLEDIVHYDLATNLESKLHMMINNEQILNTLLKDINNIKNNKPLEDPHLFGMIEVLTHSNIDKLMHKIIDDFDFLNLFLDSKNFNKFKNLSLGIFKTLENKYPFMFKNRTNSNLLNFQMLYSFHDWFTKDYTDKKYEDMMEKFIKMIDFPVDLQES